MLQCGLKDLVCARSAGTAFAPVAGQSVELGDPYPGVGIAGHGDELAHLERRLSMDRASGTANSFAPPSAVADDRHR